MRSLGIRWSLAICMTAAAMLASCSKNSPTAPKAQSGPGPSTAKPMIYVTSPARSEMLTAGTRADTPISISGDACDSTGVGMASLNVLGSPVAISGTPPCVSFDVPQTSRWGLSIVTAAATATSGKTGTLVQSYLRSPAYFDAATLPNDAAKVPAATVFQLNQAFLDDHNRLDANDLATILERKLDGMDWNAMVPTVLHAQPDANGDGVVDTQTHHCLLQTRTNTMTGFLVKKGGAITRGAVHVQITTVGSQFLQIDVSVDNLRLPLDVTGYLDPAIGVADCLAGVSANVTGSVLADRLELVMDVAPAPDINGRLALNAATTSVNMTNPRLDIDWGPLSFISNLLDQITNSTTDAFKGLIGTALGTSSGTALSAALNSLLTPLDVALPTPNGTEIDVRSAIESFEVLDGGIRVGVATQFYPKSPVLGRGLLPHGALRKDGAVPDFQTTPYSIAAGTKDDAVNQMLWAAWAAGAFDFGPLTGDPCLAGLPGSIKSIRAGLPPVLMPGRNGHAMEIGLGDLYVEYEAPAMVASLSHDAAATTSATSFYVSGLAGIDLAIDATTHKVKASLDPNPEIHVQVVSADSGVDPATLQSGIEGAIRCLYEHRVAAVIEAFPVLEFDIGSLGIPNIPPGTTLGIGGANIERMGDYMVLTGSVEVR